MAGCIDDYRQHSELTNFCEKKLWHFAMTINKIENRKLLYYIQDVYIANRKF